MPTRQDPRAIAKPRAPVRWAWHIWFLIALLAGVRMLEYNAAAGLGSVLIAFLGLLFGTLIWRIVIEIYMVIFSINDRLGEIRDSLKKD